MDIPYNLILGALVVGIIIAVVGINMTIKPAYDFGACTFNQFDCEPGDIVCTDEIEDECCDPIRMCAGTTDTAASCYTKYCTADEQCVPVYSVANDNYECKCESPY